MAITKNLLFLMASLLCSTPIIAQVTSTYQVGPQPDGSAVVPTNQVVTPAGTQINFNGRPLAIAIRPDQKTAAILNTGAGSSTITTAPLVIVDLLTNTIKQQFTPPTNAKASYDGVLYSADGNHLYFSHDSGTVTILSVAADGSVTLDTRVSIPTSAGAVNNGSLALSTDGNTLYVVLNMSNSIGLIDLKTNTFIRNNPGAERSQKHRGCR